MKCSRSLPSKKWIEFQWRAKTHCKARVVQWPFEFDNATVFSATRASAIEPINYPQLTHRSEQQQLFNKLFVATNVLRHRQTPLNLFC